VQRCKCQSRVEWPGCMILPRSGHTELTGAIDVFLVEAAVDYATLLVLEPFCPVDSRRAAGTICAVHGYMHNSSSSAGNRESGTRSRWSDGERGARKHVRSGEAAVGEERQGRGGGGAQSKYEANRVRRRQRWRVADSRWRFRCAQCCGDGGWRG
jgi:hypothetical protein